MPQLMQQGPLPGPYQYQAYAPMEPRPMYPDARQMHGALEAYPQMMPQMPGAMLAMPAAMVPNQMPGLPGVMVAAGQQGQVYQCPQPGQAAPTAGMQSAQPAVQQAVVGSLNDLGAGDVQDLRRKKQEEMRRALEEQIAQKERQKKEEEERRRQEDQRQAQIAPARSPQVAQIQDMAGMPPLAPETHLADPARMRLGNPGPEDAAQEQRRKKQEEMKRALAEQIVEKERQKKEEEERRRLEDERENERIRREQAAEEARLEARRLEDEARQKALHQQNERAAAERRNAAEEDESHESPGPLPNKQTMTRSSRSTRSDAPGQSRSDLFGLPQAANASPVPWEAQSIPNQQAAQAAQNFSGQSFRNPPGHGGFNSTGPSAQQNGPVSDMLQGLMYQQQELYRHQQEALARLQEEADRLRHEKEVAKQDLLDMKAKQLEEKEKDVRKMQKKLRQMLIQGGNTAQLGPLENMMPSISSTPKDGSQMRESEAMPWGEFYSKYETSEHVVSQSMAAETSGYPSDEDFQKMRESNDPSAWPVAPVPWLQPENVSDGPLAGPGSQNHIRIISSTPDAPKPGSIGTSLFEDSWGKPLEDMQQLEGRLDETKESSLRRAQANEKGLQSLQSFPASQGLADSSALQGTLVGESKLVDPQGTDGATWKALTHTMNSESHQKSMKQVVEPSSLGSTSKLLDSLAAKNEEDTADPLRLLEGAVNAIREARAEVGAVGSNGQDSLSNSAFLSGRKHHDRGSAFSDAGSLVDDFLRSQASQPSEWGNVCRHFGAETTQTPRPEAVEATSRPSVEGQFHNRLTCDFEGFPSYAHLDRLDQTNSVSGAKEKDRETAAQDSLDLLQHGHEYKASNVGAMASSNASLVGLGTQRPIAKDDFAALAAATPEDFDAFLSRLKDAQSQGPKEILGHGQSGQTSARGRSGQVSGMSVKERAKFGSPTLRAAAGSLLGNSDRPPSGHSARPESGSSATSLNSGGGLRDLRNQRRKPKTAEDALLHGSDLTVPGPAAAGPGTSLHATVPATMQQEASVLQGLRAEKKHQGTFG